MNHQLLRQGLAQLAQAGQQAARQASQSVGVAVRDPAVRELATTVRVAVTRGAETARTLSQTPQAREMGRVAVAAAASLPVRDIAKICGRAGLAGAVVDGAIGTFQAAQHVQSGRMDTAQAFRHVSAEAGCGFVTSTSGTAGTLAVYMITGSMGPAALAAGMGASLGSRYLYRRFVGETLPPEGSGKKPEDKAEDAHHEPPPFEHIGPSPNE